MDETTVRTLLTAAGLPATDPEIATLTAGYPAQRAGVEELYTAPEVRYLDPALRFRAAAVAPEVDWTS